jgi:hypothetical protein
MTSTDPSVTTDLDHAKLLSAMSNYPVKYAPGLFVWHGEKMTFRFAVTIALRLFRNMQVTENTKKALAWEHEELIEEIAGAWEDEETTAGDWFYRKSTIVRNSIKATAAPFNLKHCLVVLNS